MKTQMRTIALCLSMIICTAVSAQNMEGAKHHKKEMKREQMDKLKTELQLTDEQFGKVKSIIKERNQKLKALKTLSNEGNKTVKEDKKGSRSEVLAATKSKLAKVLNEEQMKKYMEIQKEKREKKRGIKEMEHTPMKEGDIHQKEG